MNLRKVLDDYTECNNFEIRYIDNKIKIFYYENIDNFTSNIVEISSKENRIKIKGKDLVIETMFREYLIVGGKIKSIDIC